MTRRLFRVELLGAVLREVLPLLRKLADALDPAGSAPGWTPLPKPLTVPAAWVELEARR